MSTGTTTVGKFVWHEQVSPDPKQAQDFYTELFGWGAEAVSAEGMDYTMISSGGQSHGGYGTAMEGAPPPHWLSHVRVEKLHQRSQVAGPRGGEERVDHGPLCRDSTLGFARASRLDPVPCPAGQLAMRLLIAEAPQRRQFGMTGQANMLGHDRSRIA